MEQADAIQNLLRKVNSFKVTKTNLELRTPDKEVMRYRKQ